MVAVFSAGKTAVCFFWTHCCSSRDLWCLPAQPSGAMVLKVPSVPSSATLWGHSPAGAFGAFQRNPLSLRSCRCFAAFQCNPLGLRSCRCLRKRAPRAGGRKAAGQCSKNSNLRKLTRPREGPRRSATRSCICHLRLYPPLLQHCQCWELALIPKLC